MDYAHPELADALAAQYVAGTLRGRARDRFEALLPSHPALQSAVRDWQGRLMPLTEVLPEAPPPGRIWQGIESQLWPQPRAAAAPSWWQRLGLWRGLAGTAFAGVLALGAMLAIPPPVQPPVVVVLASTGAAADAGGSIVASFSGDGRALVTRPLTPVSLRADRVLELWSVPPRGNPRSLGLISAGGLTVLDRGRLPAALLKGGTAALAVSIEPPGGSPTGLPTGPVVFAGKLQT
ncbi:MAG: anti-sigma factor [Burkholderiales bacterium]|nr:anti-sigma factor [Burkholderiales bacterium]MDE2277136.1 anti-sigma factor [Burkholderiales bacterium]